MTRPTRLIIHEQALLHNLARIQDYAPNTKVIAMVKADAYGHGIKKVAHVLRDSVAAFGVACLEEALQIRAENITTPIILMEGNFDASELKSVCQNHLEIVIHHQQQLSWLLANPLPNPIKTWIKLDTGMHRLGFSLTEFSEVYQKLKTCAWVNPDIGLMTHFASSDELQNPLTMTQTKIFNDTLSNMSSHSRSLANSAAIIAWPETHSDYIRPGIMLYGISPFADKTGKDFNLQAAMSLESHLIAVKSCKKGESVGYGAIWQAPYDTTIGVVAIGYGDGYPRHMRPETPVLVNGQRAPLVGRVSMDMLTVDLKHQPNAKINDPVELWGPNLPIEEIAQHAGTSAYELACQIGRRVR